MRAWVWSLSNFCKKQQTEIFAAKFKPILKKVIWQEKRRLKKSNNIHCTHLNLLSYQKLEGRVKNFPQVEPLWNSFIWFEKDRRLHMKASTSYFVNKSDEKYMQGMFQTYINLWTNYRSATHSELVIDWNIRTRFD